MTKIKRLIENNLRNMKKYKLLTTNVVGTYLFNILQ